MKKTIHSFLFLMFSAMTIGLNAQSLESDPAEPTAEGQACWDMAIQVDYDITNITSGDLNFLWRADRIDVPEQWRFKYVMQ